MNSSNSQANEGALSTTPLTGQEVESKESVLFRKKGSARALPLTISQGVLPQALRAGAPQRLLISGIGIAVILVTSRFKLGEASSHCV